MHELFNSWSINYRMGKLLSSNAASKLSIQVRRNLPHPSQTKSTTRWQTAAEINSKTRGIMMVGRDLKKGTFEVEVASSVPETILEQMWKLVVIAASLEKMTIMRTELAETRWRDETKVSSSESDTRAEILQVGGLVDNGNKVSLYDSWLMSRPGPKTRLSYFLLTWTR